MTYDETSCACRINPHAPNNDEKARSIRPCVMHRIWADQQMADARRAALVEAADRVAMLVPLRKMWSGGDLAKLAETIRQLPALLDTAASCYCDAPEIQTTCPVHGVPR